MKRMVLWLLCAMLAALLCACECQHQWQDASCESPKTCTLCAAAEGEALGHSWKDATCKEPKTCSTCGKLEGSALGHDYLEATCTDPQKCKVCGLYNGSRREHEWTENTCKDLSACKFCGITTGGLAAHKFTEPTCSKLAECTVCGYSTGYYADHGWASATDVAPMTCRECGKQQGGLFVSHEAFQLEDCASYVGIWKGRWLADGESWFGVTVDGMDLDFQATVTLEMTPYGKMVLTVEFDEETHKAAYRTAMIERVYSYLEMVNGLDREQAQLYMLQHEATTVEGYVDSKLPWQQKEEHVYCYFWMERQQLLCADKTTWSIQAEFEASVESNDGQRLILLENKMGRLELDKQP